MTLCNNRVSQYYELILRNFKVKFSYYKLFSLNLLKNVAYYYSVQSVIFRHNVRCDAQNKTEELCAKWQFVFRINYVKTNGVPFNTAQWRFWVARVKAQLRFTTYCDLVYLLLHLFERQMIPPSQGVQSQEKKLVPEFGTAKIGSEGLEQKGRKIEQRNRKYGCREIPGNTKNAEYRL